MSAVLFLVLLGFGLAAVVLRAAALYAYWLCDRIGQEMGWWR